MNAIALLLLIAYLSVVLVICVYGAHRYWMVWTFLRTRRAEAAPTATFDELPPVTVQLPMFNERRVAERVIEAACAIDYPADRLQIQVLDDSTDESAEIAKACCERLSAAGHRVDYIHRDDRTGFKAGALAGGLESAEGRYIAVFDADFVPPADVIRRTIHQFTDSRIGMVQTRWEHLNRDDSLLTRVQAMFLDGHFVIEQAARAGTGRWFNFNGTAGIWDRRCIEEAGGWQHDTLTEDTDLSYRAQLAGWEFKYLDDVCCPAEIPRTVDAFLSQQHRWNKGLIQTAIKLMPRILRSDAPIRRKVEAWFHLTSPLVHLVILLLVLLIIPTMFIAIPALTVRPVTGLLLGLVVLTLGAVAAGTFYVASQRGRPVVPTVLRLPALMAYGVGISVVNSRAVLEACLGRQSPFVRTPKFNGADEGDTDPILATRPRPIPGGVVEVLLGVTMLTCFALAFTRPFTLVGAPFLLLFAAGYLAVGLPVLVHERRRRLAAVRS